ncbi:MAG TPA: LysE family transporter [Bacteroidia bacterium]|jgi:threonine/homoserine/homoserine lactone efflux protein|nr:LysE family transporter [Bacteroidia bacterium]
MFHTFFHGVYLGLGLAFLFIGPSLFALIQASIKNGFRSAAVMAFGISLSDVLLVSIAFFGASQLLDKPKNVEIMRIIASIVLFAFGIYTLFQKHDKQDAKNEKVEVPDSKHLPIMFVKGFFLNLFNPSVLLFWIAWVGVASSQYTTREEIIAFFAGTLGTVFATDVLKSLAAHSIKRLLTHKVMKFVHYLMGVALIICGIVLVYEVYFPPKT